MKRILALVAFAGLVSPASAQQRILLEVDVSAPTFEVTYRATGAPPLIDDSSATGDYGITLVNIYTTPFLRQNNVPMGDLAADGIVFNRVDNSVLGSQLDLNWWVSGSVETLNFTTSAPAFTGSSLGPGGPIQPIGFIGDIIVGYRNPIGSTFGSLAVIGQYKIVPEPSAALLLCLGLPLLWRRR